MLFNRFKNKVSITYGITVCNEYAELKNLLKTLLPLINKNDEVVVLQDITHRDSNVDALLDNYCNDIKRAEARLDGDFATFKNLLIENAGGDFLFQIDADEVPKKTLIKKLKKKIVQNPEADCFLVPRINIVHGLTPEDIVKWKWNVDKKNRVNFPDYQFRIFKLNGQIKWKNKLHEELYGYSHRFYLPHKNEDYCLLHVKTIEKQKKQDEFYSTIN